MQATDDSQDRLSHMTPETCVVCGALGLPCEGKTPCNTCQTEGKDCSYDWQVGPHIFEALPDTVNLTDEIPLFSPFDPVGGQMFTYGTVYPESTRDGQLVAVKVMKADWSYYEPGKRRPFELTLRAAYIWSRLRHENVMPLVGVASFPAICWDQQVALCLVTPWAEAGNVMGYLKLNPNAELTRFGWEVAKGVKYLHELDWGPVVHGDLKGNNILITLNNNVPTAKISDFGLSSLPARRGNIRLGGDATARDPRRMARERIFLSEFGSRRGWEVETTASDIWELMRCILEIYTGSVPYQEIPINHEGDLWKALIEEKNPQRPDNALIDDDMWALMISSWSLSPGARPDIREVEGFLGKRAGTCGPGGSEPERPLTRPHDPGYGWE